MIKLLFIYITLILVFTGSVILISNVKQTPKPLKSERVVNYIKRQDINVPMYPVINNEDCENMHSGQPGYETGNFGVKYVTNNLNGDWKYVEDQTTNKLSGHLYKDDNGKLLFKQNTTPSIDNFYYTLLNPVDGRKVDIAEEVQCLWQKDKPNLFCNNRGDAYQLCTKKGGGTVECNSIDNSEIDIRIKDYDCNCNIYTSTVENKQKKYVGKDCDYDDNDYCNNRGTANDNGICTCTVDQKSVVVPISRPYSGNRCQNSDNETCSGNGYIDFMMDPRSNGNCVCSSDNPYYNTNFITSNCSVPSLFTNYEMTICFIPNTETGYKMTTVFPLIGDPNTPPDNYAYLSSLTLNYPPNQDQQINNFYQFKLLIDDKENITIKNIGSNGFLDVNNETLFCNITESTPKYIFKYVKTYTMDNHEFYLKHIPTNRYIGVKQDPNSNNQYYFHIGGLEISSDQIQSVKFKGFPMTLCSNNSNCQGLGYAPFPNDQLICYNNVCLPREYYDSKRASCTTAQGNICVDGFTTQTCADNTNCPNGQACVQLDAPQNNLCATVKLIK